LTVVQVGTQSLQLFAYRLQEQGAPGLATEHHARFEKVVKVADVDIVARCELGANRGAYRIAFVRLDTGADEEYKLPNPRSTNGVEFVLNMDECKAAVLYLSRQDDVARAVQAVNIRCPARGFIRDVYGGSLDAMEEPQVPCEAVEQRGGYGLQAQAARALREKPVHDSQSLFEADSIGDRVTDSGPAKTLLDRPEHCSQKKLYVVRMVLSVAKHRDKVAEPAPVLLRRQIVRHDGGNPERVIHVGFC